MNTFYSMYDNLKKIPPIKLSDSWLITKYEDVKTCLLNTKAFSVRRAGRMFENDELDHEHPKTKFAKDILHRWIIHMDEGVNDTKKELVQKIVSFTNGRLESEVNLRYEELRAKLAGKEEYDLKYDFALPIVSSAVMAMLGVERTAQYEAQELKIFRQSEKVAILVEEIILSMEEVEEMADSLLYLIKLGAGFDGLEEEPKIEEFDTHFTDFQIQQSLILSTFVYSVPNLIVNAVKGIVENIEQVNGDNLKKAILESLRIESPVQAVLRICTEDTSVGGATIPKDDTLTIFVGSANRDGSVEAFENPTKFDLSRKKMPLMTFGYGVHKCIGQSIGMSIGNQVIGKMWEAGLIHNLRIKEAVWDDHVLGYRTMSSFLVSEVPVLEEASTNS